MFRGRILQGDDFFEYFNKNISASTKDVKEVIARFEIGLYQYLIGLGYGSSAYGHAENVSIYWSPYQYLIKNGVFLKKKIFAKDMAQRENIYAAMQYAHRTYGFDVSIITEMAKRKYGICFEDKTMQTIHTENLRCYYSPECKFDINYFLKIYKDGHKIFIYGAGANAHYVQWVLHLNGIKVEKFLVTDLQGNKKEINGIEVLQWDAKLLEENDYLMVALNQKNSREVYDKLSTIKNVLWLNKPERLCEGKSENEKMSYMGNR